MVVTVNDPGVLTTNAVLFALVIAGAWLTVILSGLVADSAPALLESVTFTVKLTGVVLAGPEGVPVIAPELLMLRPAGNAPDEME